MGNNITELMVTSFEGNLRLAAQNMQSVLESGCMVETGKEGDLATPVTIVKPVTAQKITTRNSDTVISDVDSLRRWFEPTAYSVAELLDWHDATKVSGMYNPNNAYLRTFVAALRRAADDRILASAFAASTTGVKGGSTTSFPAGNIVALTVGGANSGLNVEKLKAALEIFIGNDVSEEDELCCAITARQNKELLQEIEILKSDYRQTAVIQNGRIQSFMGITFKHVQFDNATRYPDAQSALIDGSSDYLIPIWAKSGMALGKWKDIEGKMDERPDKNYAIQTYACSQLGATRTEEEKVVQMVCYGS